MTGNPARILRGAVQATVNPPDMRASLRIMHVNLYEQVIGALTLIGRLIAAAFRLLGG